MKSAQVFTCPSNPAGGWLAMDGQFTISYGANGHDQYNTPIRSIGGGRGVTSLAAINAPAQCILITESNAGWSEMNMDGCWDWFDHNNASMPCGIFAGHMGNTNFIFADGHVKPMKPNATASLNPPLNMWAIDGPNVLPFGGDGGANMMHQLNEITKYYAR
ncbi:MAG TPA: hypothetical protein DCZ72_11095 [Armatimonadetes bacterium]|nr:hypothetical protein [Armatimonadota bacterium]